MCPRYQGAWTPIFFLAANVESVFEACITGSDVSSLTWHGENEYRFHLSDDIVKPRILL